MRMTNKIMQNNSLYNINQNKVLQDKLSTQMSTQKELTRPSDDPVVAIRALRLRSTVSELTQFYKKNAPDADAWLKVTSDGLGTVTDILTDLSKNANKGANKDLTADDLDIIVTNMKSLTEEFYSTGNLDYAGRYVFSGFRTDTPMEFTAADVANTEKPIPSYTITQQIGIEEFDSSEYTFLGNLNGINSTNISDASHYEEETNISNTSVHRLRLAYDDLDSAAGGSVAIKLFKDGTEKATELACTEADRETAYTNLLSDNESTPPVVSGYYIKETGELLLSNAAYEKLENDSKSDTGLEFRVEYTKSEWANGDLRPEHYFACKSKDSLGKVITYNEDYLDKSFSDKTRQTIAYDVGYNQTIDVNTTADEVFTHSLNRDMDDLSNALSDFKNISNIKNDIELAIKACDDPDELKKLNDQLAAADKAYTYIRETIHDMMGSMIKKSQSYLDATNVAVTDNGTRMSRLELISNRLMEQQTTFRTLQSENEDVDISEVAISLTSAELTYNSSLMATGKIMQTSLMNYL